MLRNLLYSFCLHIMFLLILIFNNDINSLFNKKAVNINSLNISSDFLKKNDVKSTNINYYSNLSLNEKIELYKIAKENGYDPETSNEYSTEDVKEAIQEKVLSYASNDEYILYLGPTDYKRYVEKLNRENSQALENIIADISSNNKENNVDNLDTFIDKTIVDKPITNNKTATNIDKTINIDTQKTVIKPNKTVVKTSNKKTTKLLNIDPDKIFTKNDIKQIKEIIKKESNSEVSLSVRERVNIQNQLIACYKNALIQTTIPSKVPVSVTINLFPNGIINTKEINFKIIDDDNLFTEKDYNETINNAKIALAYCNPLRNLPTNKYTSWQNINFIFDAINK